MAGPFEAGKRPIKIKSSHVGMFRSETGTKPGQKIPLDKIKQAENSSSVKERKRAVFAANARKWNH